jgi:hypothetical protein
MKTLGKFEVIDITDPEVGFDNFALTPVLTVDEWISDEMRSKKNDGLDIAHTYGIDAKDNAYLFAAMPEIMAALNLILRSGLTKETRKKARDAIKKSRGM